ncbi:MAG TPA: hypothetical protein VFQ53_41205 [Kofleriaceae bacterium]|nr:hypothetical protein [Kofleriaceae bacterium]
MPAQTVTYRREELYCAVWREPATEVAKRYGMSSNALGKICDRLQVPTPTRGYWARRAVGIVDPTPPLPALSRALETELTVTRKGRRPDRTRIAASILEGRAAMGAPIVVPAHLKEPHPLVSTALTLLARATLNNGLASCREERCLDIVVAPRLLERVALIMNTLILALEERGFPVEVTDVLPEGVADRDARSNVTRVLVGGEWIRFGIVERLRQHRAPWNAKPPAGLKGPERELWLHWNRPRMQLVPSGKPLLLIKEPDVGVQVSWADGKKRLEARLNDFVKQLFVVAEATKQTHQADHSWRETYERESRRNREARARAEEEAHRVAAVRDALARWREARDLRQLVHEMRVAQQGTSCDWLDWAEVHAARIERELRGDRARTIAD